MQRTDSYINKTMRGREQSCLRGERKQKRRSTDTKKTRQGEVKERERAGELTGQKKSRTARPRKGPMNAGKRTNKKPSLLRRRTTDEPDSCFIRTCIRKQGLNGDKPGAVFRQ